MAQNRTSSGKEKNSGYDQFFQKAREQAPLKASSNGRPFKLKQTPQAQASEGSPVRPLRATQASPGGAPERALRDAMTKKIRAGKSGKRMKAKFPLASALALGGALALGLGYVMAPQAFTFIASHVDVSLFGHAEAAGPKEGTPVSRNDGPPVEKLSTAGSPKGEKVAALTPEGVAQTKDEKVTDTRGWTPDELSFFNKLNERKVELDQRDAELTKLEGELQQQKTELDQKIQQLVKMRSEISGTLKARVSLDQEKVDKLVQVYSGMKAPQAAKILESINEDLAVEILDKMKKKSAAEVLNVMEAKKAEKLSEMLAGYARTPASAAGAANKEGGD